MKEGQETPEGAFVPKYELGLRYFPHSPTKKAATDNLTRAINRCKGLSAALARAPGGYNVLEKRFTPLQVRIIEKFFGEP